MNELFDADFSWHSNAACSDVEDPDIFFPPRDKALYKTIANQAKEYCFGTSDTPPCPVRAFCLWDAIEAEEAHGIWGGLSHRERNALVRKWSRKYKNIMPLKDYVFQQVKKGKQNGSTKN